MKAVKMQTSKADIKKLKALVKALDGMADDDVRHFQAIEKKYETVMKENDKLNKILLEKERKLSELDQKLLEKDQKISETDQKILEKDQQILETDQKIAELDLKIAEKNQKLIELEHNIHTNYKC